MVACLPSPARAASSSIARIRLPDRRAEGRPYFNRRFSVAPFNFRTHTREMDNDKQKGSVWDGIKVAFRIIEAAETLNSGRSGFDEFVHGVKEKVLMGAAITAVCGVFYVMVFVFHW
jgi:hypothetical protein